MLSSFRNAKIAAAAVVGAFTLTSGLAAAGALPGAAQDVAATALSKVGINVPDHNDDHADVRGRSADDHTTTPEADEHANGDDTTHGQGSEISDLAHNTPTDGGKGAVVSKAASDGRSHAGEHTSDDPATHEAGEHATETEVEHGTETEADHHGTNRGSSPTSTSTTSTTVRVDNSGSGSLSSGSGSTSSGSGSTTSGSDSGSTSSGSGSGSDSGSGSSGSGHSGGSDG